MTAKKSAFGQIMGKVDGAGKLIVADLKADDVASAALDVAMWGSCIAFAYYLLPTTKVATWMATHQTESTLIALPLLIIGGPLGVPLGLGLVQTTATANMNAAASGTAPTGTKRVSHPVYAQTPKGKILVGQTYTFEPLTQPDGSKTPDTTPIETTVDWHRIGLATMIGTLAAAGIKYGLFSDLLGAVTSISKGIGLAL